MDCMNCFGYNTQTVTGGADTLHGAMQTPCTVRCIPSAWYDAVILWRLSITSFVVLEYALKIIFAL
ncbi:hypothetical protein [Chryseobacterium nepalense]|uniref:Uncharacterized protein n=1 Tax=Chryseobacterium nepalense TaxID=1854498 RepID=A0ABY4K1I0_9FLAO|nr:hypothetical protein [Chryseobacterium nepalense]UPQ74201.1 hypothetical protein M0D58_09055 [Chryseobacterium nepalense]